MLIKSYKSIVYNILNIIKVSTLIWVRKHKMFGGFNFGGGFPRDHQDDSDDGSIVCYIDGNEEEVDNK